MISRNLTELEQDFVQAVILNGLAPLAGERTIQALYYILRGRKANQTQQDVHLYSLQPYYRMFPRLSKEQWEEKIASLAEKRFIAERLTDGAVQKPTFTLTERGKEVMAHGREQYKLERWFAPFTSVSVSDRLILFWQRLHLMVQTVSQLIAGDLAFLPVVRDKRVQQWVKQALADAQKRQMWLDGLHDELYALLEPLPVSVQELIVSQFSGAQQVGSTVTQLALCRGEAPSYIQLQFRYGLAESMNRLERDGGVRFPLLSSLNEHSQGKDPRLSESANLTYQLVKRNYSVEEIARIRQIKPGTVEDHLVEIALHCPEWDFSRYVSPSDCERILRVSEELGTVRLRLLKDRLGERYTYLQIRLALAARRGGNVNAGSTDGSLAAPFRTSVVSSRADGDD
jgi:uncharacterized protein YpbB